MTHAEFKDIVDKHAERYGKKMTLHVAGVAYREAVSENPKLKELAGEELDITFREIIGNKLKAELGE